MRPEALKRIENPEMVLRGALFSQGNIDVTFLAVGYRSFEILPSKRKPSRQSSKRTVFGAVGSVCTEEQKAGKTGEWCSNRINENIVLHIGSRTTFPSAGHMYPVSPRRRLEICLRTEQPGYIK